MGTLVFRHNGRNIRHEQCLYDPSYSNIISGLRMPDDFTLKGTKNTAELKTGRKVLYKMTRDPAGLWIEPDNVVADWKAAGIKRTVAGKGEVIKQARDLHERNHLPALHNYKHTRKKVAPHKFRILLKYRRISQMSKGPVSGNSRKPTIHSQDDKTRNLYTCQPTRTSSGRTLGDEPSISQEGFGVLILHEARGDHFTETHGSTARSLRRWVLRRTGVTIPDRSNNC